MDIIEKQKLPADQSAPRAQASLPQSVSRDDAMARALAHHQAGRTQDALRIYEAILQANPRDADALHLSGVVWDAKGNPARGAERIGQALAISEKPSFHSNLGMALGHLGRHEEAIACYERALVLKLDYPEALNNLGVSLEALRRPVEAEAAYRRAITFRPGYGEALANLGNSLRAQGRHADAVAAFEAAVANNPATPRAMLGHSLRALGQPAAAEAAFRADVANRPDNPEALNALAAHLGEAGGHEEAASLFPKASALRKNFPEAHANLGHALQQLGRLDEAAAACERALALRPDFPEALTNLGNAMRGLDRLDESETVLRRAVALRPGETQGYNNLAITLMHQERPHEALALLDLAAAIDPQEPETQHHRAMILLRQGRLAEGWGSYDARFRIQQSGGSYTPFAARAPWAGEKLDGRQILLLAEQGMGDVIQFCRYVPLVAARGGRVLLSAHKPLARLLETLAGVAQLLPADTPMPAYDVHCALMSLPRLFATTLETIPAQVPYLRAAPEAVSVWRTRVGAAEPGLRVGFAWAGNPRHLGDRQRSLTLGALRPLWAVPGVRWFSLQVGHAAAALAAAADPPPGGLTDLAPHLTDFAETAAAIQALDLVITVDTAVAHVAGALGRPVWVLLPRVPDWRWLSRGETSPWYPSLRLFRQDATRQWAPVMAQVADALRILAGG